MQRITGWSESGSTIVSTGGLKSTTKVQGSFPLATVTVYATGTVTLAAIFSDNVGTPLSNPFTASATGSFGFFVGNGAYDIVFSGTGITIPFTISAISAFDESILLVDVTAAPFFASPIASAAANAAAFTAALASMTAGILYFPPGTYATNGSLQPKSGVTIKGAGIGATTINYSGSGWWLDLPASTLVNYFGLCDMTVSCSGASLGAMRWQRVAQAFNNNFLCQQCWLSNLFIQATVSQAAGSVGLSITEYIQWTLSNVTINNFETPAIFDRGGMAAGTRVRFQSFRFGPKWTNNIGGCQDTYINSEFLGPVTTGAAGVDYGYTCTIDATFVTFINAEYETQPGGKSQGYLHITAQGGRFMDINGAWSQGIVPDNPLVVDNGFNSPQFIGTFAGPGENPMVIGTVGVDPMSFIGCNDDMNALAAAVTASKVVIVGVTGGATSLIQYPHLILQSPDTINMSGGPTTNAINFGTDVTSNSKRGLFWNNDTTYGIFRAAGAWVGAFVQLTIAWATGIILDPGASSTKSVVYIPQGGLVASSVNYIATETGANNAIAAAFSSNNPALAGGLLVTVKLAHTLQAGANTFAYNGGGAVIIKSHINPNNNIATPYIALGTITLMYDGAITAWLDMSQ